MRQIVIQKKYLLFVPVLRETGEIFWRIFLLIVHFIFNITKKIKKVLGERIPLFSFCRFLEDLFRKFLKVNKVIFKKNYLENFCILKTKNDFEIYRNLLAPPRLD